ncbi:MAG: DUF1573 domain-containing protein [Flavobacteriales bacterium]|jgi:hypothetical protein|nr:DUF1573 domain-containing protein [Flavobacteriales bacterium]
MKKVVAVFTLFFLAALFVNVNAQAIGGAEISFETETHDYGVIQQHGDGTYDFVFKNTGSVPLLISECVGSCGCTVPEWPREPIAPGASAKLKVTYDTKRVGVINKSVTIKSNAVNAPTKIIRIKGEVKA